MLGLYSDSLDIHPKSLKKIEVEDMSEEDYYGVIPLNQILYGPPGTGKTYSTINRALEILDPEMFYEAFNSDLSDAQYREKCKKRFDELVTEGRIRFTTFHQSFSYEDFVEGIRAVVDEDEEQAGAPRFVIEKGVFMELCESAIKKPELDATLGIREDATIWKISIGEVNGERETRDYCFAHDEMRIGWPNAGNLADGSYRESAALSGHNKSALEAFYAGAQEGDVVLCFASRSTICAVGVVSGEYRYDKCPPKQVREDFVQVRPVKWLLKDINFSIIELNGNKSLIQQTMYPLHRMNWPRLRKALEDKGLFLNGESNAVEDKELPYVLIIDEINRGNVSRIFGELITLLEPSKRAGSEEALSVVLPYSKQTFSVPNNVYVIGTMNTADRSLAGLDIALRRRFEFDELMPDLELLEDIEVEEGGHSLNVSEMLKVINQRIDVLLGRDYQIGHTYFLPLKDEPTLEYLATIFSTQIIPLLKEYFFDDWQRIAWVLNDHRKKEPLLPFVQKVAEPSIDELFGNGVTLPMAENNRWQINEEAYWQLASYVAIL